MPIYAYKCDSCGFAKDALQKFSDAPLTQCPSCGAESFKKQLTAAGFQLKGSGWYATDFKGGNSGAPAAVDDDKKSGETATPKADVGTDAKVAGKTESGPVGTPSVKKAEAAAPAAGSGS